MTSPCVTEAPPPLSQRASKRNPSVTEGQHYHFNAAFGLRFLTDFWHLLLFSSPTAQDGARGPQDRPKIAQEASKIAP